MPESMSTHLSRGDVLERSYEMAQLEARLASAASGGGTTVVLTGPAGIGKSTLLTTAVALAESAGFSIARAQGRRLEENYDFGVALQLFEPFAHRDDLFEGGARLARPLLDLTVRDRLPEGDSFSVVHGLYWLTAHLADAKPVLIVVDDVQWADGPSLRYLAYLAERLERTRAVVLVAVQTDVDGSLPPAIEPINQSSSATRLQPEALSPSAVETLADRFLADHQPHGSIASECHRLTSGNPLMVVETLRELADSGELLSGGPGASPLAALLPAVRRRLGRLGAPTRRLAAAAAVLGDASLDVVAEVAGLPLPAASMALNELRAAALLEPDDPVRVIHGIVEEVIEAEVSDADRATLHREAFHVLDRRGAPPEVLAAHARTAGVEGSPRLVEILRASANASISRGRPKQAVLDLRRLLAEPLQPAVRAEILAGLARAEALAGDPNWKADVEKAVALDEAEGPRARLRVGEALFTRGSLGPAAAQYELGLDAVADPSSELGLRLLVGVSQSSLIDVTNDRSWLGRVEAVLGPDPTGDSRAERDLLRHLAYAWALSDGTRKEVLDLAHRAVRLDDPIGLARESTFAVGVLAMLFADDEHVLPDLLDRVIDHARADGRLTLQAGHSNYRGARRLLLGQVDAAIADLMLARDTLADAWTGVLPAASGNLALAHLERDELGAANDALALPIGDETLERSASFNAWLFARSQVRAAHGDIAGALADLMECGRRERRMGSLNPATIPWEFLAGDLLVRSGRGDDAFALVDDAVERARRFGAPRTLATGLRSAAMLVEGNERIELLTEAVDVVHNSPWRLELTRAVLMLGKELEASGRRHDGQSRLRAALDLAEDSGLVRLRADATKSLRATGARPRRARITGPDSLTPTERIIAELASAGMTNRDIAEQRFVSVKAVEYHLANVYRKLSIRRRTELGPALSTST